MKYFVFAIYDTKAEAYQVPFTLPAVGMAKRWFYDQVMNKDTEFSKHPEDYFLTQIGLFDVFKGRLIGSDTPETIMSAMEARTQSQNPDANQMHLEEVTG